MAQVDLTTTPSQLATIKAAFNGVRSKLAANKAVLTRLLSQDDGQVKLQAFAQTDAGEWLREAVLFSRDLNKIFSQVGLRD